MSTSATFLSGVKTNKTVMKVFLVNGTMLEGSVVDFDEVSVCIDKCLVFFDKIISMTPKNR